jgi:ankyrin repeat protein
LAKLYLDSLDDKTTLRDVKKALCQFQTQKLGSNEDGLRGKLDQAYDEAMERINGQRRAFQQLAEKVLMWIVCTERPLTTSELQTALAIKVGDSAIDEDGVPRVDKMVSVCAGLVTVDKASNIIRLVHHTTQEYFQRTKTRWFPNAETDIAKVCITYLSFSAFDSGYCQSDKEFEERLRSHPLYNYAARSWGYHTIRASEEVTELASSFLESRRKVEASAQAMIAVPSLWHSGYSQEVPKGMTGLHVAAYFGLEGALRRLVRSNGNPDQKDHSDRTPLSWAADKGHDAIVKLLLETGGVDADSTSLCIFRIDSWDIEKWQDFSVLRQRMTEKVRKGIGVNNGRTPLSFASENGHDAVVRLLLADGRVNPNLKGHFGRTPLSYAAENGHESVVKLLLDSGKANANMEDDDERTPLSYAAENDYQAVIKLLFAAMRVRSSSYDPSDGKLLLRAAERGDEAVVRLLLCIGTVDINSRDTGFWTAGRTPLYLACASGHEGVVRLLLENGAELESRDISGQTALSRAAEDGHEGVVKLLLVKNANISSTDIWGWSPHSRAVARRHVSIVKLLEAATT